MVSTTQKPFTAQLTFTLSQTRSYRASISVVDLVHSLPAHPLVQGQGAFRVSTEHPTIICLFHHTLFLCFSKTVVVTLGHSFIWCGVTKFVGTLHQDLDLSAVPVSCQKF